MQSFRRLGFVLPMLSSMRHYHWSPVVSDRIRSKSKQQSEGETGRLVYANAIFIPSERWHCFRGCSLVKIGCSLFSSLLPSPSLCTIHFHVLSVVCWQVVIMLDNEFSTKSQDLIKVGGTSRRCYIALCSVQHSVHSALCTVHPSVHSAPRCA